MHSPTASRGKAQLHDQVVLLLPGVRGETTPLDSPVLTHVIRKACDERLERDEPRSTPSTAQQRSTGFQLLKKVAFALRRDSQRCGSAGSSGRVFGGHKMRVGEGGCNRPCASAFAMVWTQQALADALHRKTGVRVSRSTVQRVLSSPGPQAAPCSAVVAQS